MLYVGLQYKTIWRMNIVATDDKVNKCSSINFGEM